MEPEFKSCLSEVYLDGTPIQCQKELGHLDLSHSSESIEDYLGGAGHDGEPIKMSGAVVIVTWVSLGK